MALTDKAMINTKLGGISVRLRDLMDEIGQYDTFFQGQGVAGLVANFQFDADGVDANLVGTVSNKYAQLRRIYLGAEALAVAVNFREFAPQVEALR
jgi:hypothetical protein